MIKAKILVPDVETKNRALAGCKHYGLKVKYNRKTDPYAEIQINTAQDAENLFWLGANLAQPKIETALLKSTY